MAHTINPNQLTEGTYISVRGKVEFSRLTRFLTPEERQAAEARQKQNSQFSNLPEGPFTTITIADAYVIPAQTNGMKTKEEIYVEEKFYQGKKDGRTKFSIDNKSSNFPRFYQVRVNPDGSIDNRHAEEVPAKGELAKELDVVLILRVYKPKRFENRGLALDSVIAQEPIRYYQSNSAVQHLAQMGIIVTELSEEERNAANAAAQHAEAMAQPGETPEFTAPVTTPVAAPVGDPYSAGPVSNGPAYGNTPNSSFSTPVTPAPVYSAPIPPVAPAAPVTNTPSTAPTTNTSNEWTCSCGAHNTGKFCNECGAKRPETAAPAANPNAYVTPDALGNAPSGIRFDPNDNNRNY